MKKPTVPVGLSIILQNPGYNLKELSSHWKSTEGWDHTTVLHGCRKIMHLYKTKPEIRERLDWYKNMLEAPNGTPI